MQVLRFPRGLAVGIILFIVLVSGAEVWAQAPTATTGVATGISASGATLNGTVNANGASTTVTFEYGTTVAYGSTVTADQSPVTGSSDTAVSVALTGLASNTVYHYRVVATNSGGTTYGVDMTFTTLPQPPTVTTQAVSSITTTTAVGNANITDLGNPNPAAHGVVWNTGGTPTTADNLTDEGAAASTGAFISNITGLSSNTTYYVRAYATNTAGTAYGSEVSFTTAAPAPTATTGTATAVGLTGATLNGTVNANVASATVTFEYGTTVAYGTTVTADQSPVTGSTDTPVSAVLTGLTSNTTYHFRVVATNSGGTTYGADMTFTTLPQPPTVTTQAVSSITTTTATGNANITDLGNPNPTAHGVVWNTSGTPTTVDSLTDEGAAASTGAFISNITGLSSNTTYYVRAYATNTAGTAYGSEVSFTTVQRQVDLRVSALDTPDPVTAGSGAGNLTHTVTVTNAGPSDASGVTLSETVTLPAGTSIVSITPSGATTYAPANTSPGTWTVGNLSASASETLTVVMTVSGSTAAGTNIISNTATVTATNETLINTGDDNATESTSVVRLDDFGDAPDSYGTLLASNGARHTTVAGSNLGAILDGEPDGQPTPLADGDDLNPPAAPDDEDGVTLPPALTAGESSSVTVVGSAGGMLDGWVDYNGNGVFDQPAEHLWAGTSQVLAAGPNALAITVPATAVPGPTYARFRLSTAGGLAPTGAAPDGEVEDYRVNIAAVVPGAIIVEKQTDPDGSPQSFEFSTSYGPNFTLADDETNNSGPLSPGTYAVSEVNLPAGWSLTGATCDDGSDPSAIGLEADETVTCVFNNSALDSDGDRIVDSDEGLAGEDRDGDGVPNYLDFDPSGYLYDEATGQILIGGSISVSGPGAITVIDDGSTTGQYSWFHDGTQGDYTVTVTYPAGYMASVVCVDLGILNPDATPDPLSLGAGENGSTGFLTSRDCGSNSYYSVLRVDATNPANIINNNIPMALLTAIPMLSDRGVMMLLLLLLVSGTLILRRVS